MGAFFIPSKGNTLNTQIVPSSGGSPFDSIRKVRLDGTEYWSARDLMPLMAYSTWQNFMPVIQRASQAAKNQGYVLDELFMTSHEKSGGRPREDVHLSRFAAYLVAMNGDPRIPEVAAGQSYFAIQTRVAETMPAPIRELTFEEKMAEVMGTLSQRIEAQHAQLAIAAPKAQAFDVFLSATGDYDVRDAAQLLQRDHGIVTGQRRLFAWLREHGWLGKDNRPYQHRLDQDLLRVKAGTFLFKRTNGQEQLAAPQVRITPKGLERLRAELTAPTTQGVAS